MKKREALTSIDIDKIDSLESYIFHLGLLCVSVNTLIGLQQKAEEIGIFNLQEEEASKTVKYEAAKLFTCINDLLYLCSSRTEKGWDGMLEKVRKSQGIPTKTTKRVKKKS